MLYEITKAAHIIAVVVLIAGMVAATLFLMRPNMDMANLIKRYDRLVTTPAMLFVWVMGILLAVQGGWFSDAWLWVKIVFVVGLSGLHGAISGRLRRYDGSSVTTQNSSGWIFLSAGFALLILIVLLVTTKAF
jgi:uncharacterized membrane protein